MPENTVPTAPAAPATAPAGKPPKAEPKGLPVLPSKGKLDPATAKCAFYVVRAVSTPWSKDDGKPAAVRMIRCQPDAVRKPGTKVTLRHAKSGSALGDYVVIKAVPGNLSVWETSATV